MRQKLTAEELSVIQSRAGKKARAASPWNKGPNCDSNRAKLSYMRFRKNKPTTTKEPK